MSYKDLKAGLKDFLSFDSVTGVLFQKGKEMVVSLFTNVNPVVKVPEFCKEMSEMWEGLKQSEREMDYLCFEFGGFYVLTVRSNEMIMSFFLSDSENVEMLVNLSKVYMYDNSSSLGSVDCDVERYEEEWLMCRQGYLKALSRFLAQPQAERLLKRAKTKTKNSTNGSAKQDFWDIAEEILSEIRNRKIQASLKSEFSRILNDI
ncbi:MAG: hypothetical protein AAF558_08430 [Verrucomicrobiota bacterium]